MGRRTQRSNSRRINRVTLRVHAPPLETSRHTRDGAFHVLGIAQEGHPAALELKLRSAKGARLQEFLAVLMTAIHGDNFQPIGTDYSRGDLQCDRLLHDPLTIFVCYGPVNAGANATETAMKTAIAKVGTDFSGALEHCPKLRALYTFVIQGDI